MIKNWSNQIAQELVRKLQINQSPLTHNHNIETYAYGMEIVLVSIIKMLVFGVAGYCLGIFWPLLLVLIAFVIFRVSMGGNHMSSFINCLIISLLIIIGLTRMAVIPNWQVFIQPVFLTVLIYCAFTINLRSKKNTNANTCISVEKGLDPKYAVIPLIIWALAVCVFIFLGLSLYARCLIAGACGGIFFTTSVGSKMISSLDRWSIELNLRGGKTG